MNERSEAEVISLYFAIQSFKARNLMEFKCLSYEFPDWSDRIRQILERELRSVVFEHFKEKERLFFEKMGKPE